MKAFAGRDQDWIDIKGIIVRNGHGLNWALIDETLPGLADLKEEPAMVREVLRLRNELL